MRTRNETAPTDVLPEDRREQGYTLVELLIVIAIIGIVANILVPVVLVQLQKAKATRLVSEYKLLQNAEANYRLDDESTPPRRVRTSLPPELEPYVVGNPIQWTEGTGSRRLRKYFIREDRPNSNLAQRGVTSGLMFRSRDTALLDRIKDVYSGPIVEWSNGQTIVLLF